MYIFFLQVNEKYLYIYIENGKKFRLVQKANGFFVLKKHNYIIIIYIIILIYYI